MWSKLAFNLNLPAFASCVLGLQMRTITTSTADWSVFFSNFKMTANSQGVAKAAQESSQTFHPLCPWPAYEISSFQVSEEHVDFGCSPPMLDLEIKLTNQRPETGLGCKPSSWSATIVWMHMWHMAIHFPLFSVSGRDSLYLCEWVAGSAATCLSWRGPVSSCFPAQRCLDGGS